MSTKRKKKSKNNAVRRERSRIQAIMELERQGSITARERDRLIERGVSAARSREVAAKLDSRRSKRVRPVRGGDALEKRHQGMVNAIVARGLGRPAERSNEWNGRTLVTMAAACHPEVNLDGPALLDAVLVGRRPVAAGASHGTGDFANVLGDVARQTLLIGYNEIPDTWSGWTNRADLKDFRATPRVGLGAFAELPEVPELGEVPMQTLTDREVVAQLKNHSARFSISREAILNDDANAFAELPRKQGQAARRTVANAVYRVLTSNPTIEGFQLFSADHNTTHDAALDADGISTLRGAMRRMTVPTGGDADADEAMGAIPRFLLTPPDLYGYALEIAKALYAAGGGSNVWAGSLEVVEEQRLTNANHWFLAADGAMADTVEVAYLGGKSEPTLDSKDGWTVQGISLRVSLDFAVTLRDFRGLQRGTGGAPA